MSSVIDKMVFCSFASLPNRRQKDSRISLGNQSDVELALEAGYGTVVLHRQKITPVDREYIHNEGQAAQRVSLSGQ